MKKASITYSPSSRVDDVLFDMTHHFLNEDTAAHRHNCIEMVTIVSGHANHRFNDQSRACLPGDVFIVLPENTHAFLDCRDLELFNLSCSVDVLDSFGLESSFWHACRIGFEKGRHNLELRFDGQLFSDLRKLLNTMYEEYGGHHPERQLRLRSLLALYIMMISRRFADTPASPETEFPMVKIAAHLEKHYRDRITLDQLARLACLSPSQLVRRFKAEFQTTPIAYLIDYRLDQAARMLRSSRRSLDEVAAATGFTDGNYLIKQFRRRHGLTPSAFRRIG